MIIISTANPDSVVLNFKNCAITTSTFYAFFLATTVLPFLFTTPTPTLYLTIFNSFTMTQDYISPIIITVTIILKQRLVPLNFMTKIITITFSLSAITMNLFILTITIVLPTMSIFTNSNVTPIYLTI